MVAADGREQPATGRTDPWFAPGLRFSCTECGRCCTGGAGHVWVELAEIERLCELLGLSLDEFGRRHLRRIGNRHALLEHPSTGDCTFLRDNRCTVYQARPDQCGRFPWWPSLLESPSAWQAAAAWCEGIRDDAPLVTVEDILAVVGPTA